MQAFARFGKFIGQRRGNAVGGLKHTDGVELVEVADDEGDRHGLANRPPKPEHDAADHPSLGIGQHYLGHHFPSGGTQAVGRFLEQGRRHLKNVAHDGCDERNDHDGQDDSSRQDADTHRRPGK